MMILIALTTLATSTSTSLAEPLACTDPVTAVCGIPATPVQDVTDTLKPLIESALDELSEEIPEAKVILERVKPLNPHDTLKALESSLISPSKRRSLWIAMERAILRALAETRGLEVEKLHMQIEELKTKLNLKLASDAVWTSAIGGAEKTSNAIARTRWVTTAEYFAPSKIRDLNTLSPDEDWEDTCGELGLKNAVLIANLNGRVEMKDPKSGVVKKVYGTGGKQVVFCLGALIEAFRDPNAKSRMLRIITREISRGIDMLSQFQGYDVLAEKPANENFTPGYQRTRACLQEHYSGDFKDPKDRALKTFLTEVLGHAPSAVDYYAGEISAEVWTSQIHPDLVESEAELLSGLDHYCKRLDSASSMRPPGRWSIAFALAAPEARAKLGCTSPSPKPFCQ